MTRDEVMKKWKKREGENSSLSSYQKGDGYRRYAERQVSGTVNDAYNKGVEALNSIYNGWNSAEDIERNKQIAQNYAREINAATNQYGIGKDIMADYNKKLSGIDSAADVYSKYVTADAYNKAKKTSELSDKYKGYSYDDIQKALYSTTDADEKKFLNRYTEFSSLEDYDKAIAKEQAKIDEAAKKGIKMESVYQKNLKEARNKFEAASKYDKYADLKNNADFEEKSDPTQILNAEHGLDVDYYTANKKLFDRSITSGSFNAVRLGDMNEEMQRMGAYILNTQGEDAYLEYMREMTDYARNEQAQATAELWSGYAENHPVLATIGATALSPFVGGLAGVDQALSNASGYKSVSELSGLSSAMSGATSKISQDIKNEYGKPLEFAYDVFTTGVPNRIGQMMFGSAYNVVMGLSSFSNTYANAVQQGTDPDKAVRDAFVAGAIEYITEQIGMDWAFGKGKNAITTILKQAFAEGSEEVVGAVAQAIYDAGVNGAESEYNQNIQKYIEMGYDRAEAIKMAQKDFATDVAYQFAVAAASTVPTSGTSQVVKAMQESSAGKFVDREKLASVGNEDLQKKYGEQWAEKAKNREIYKAYSNYVEGIQNEAKEADRAATRKAIAEEYKMTEDQAEKWTNALYNGDKKLLRTELGAMLQNDVRQNKGFTQKIDSTETERLTKKLNDAFKMVKTENQIEAEKASKALKTGDKNLVNGKEASVISMKENKDGSYTVKTSEGEVPAKDVTVTEKKATALTYSANIANETLKEAYVRYYNGEDISDYDTYARYLYEAGRHGTDYSDETQIVDTLGTAKAQAFYNIGALEATQEEIADSKALEAVSTKYAEKFRPGTFKSGDYSNGKFKENKDFFRNLNRTQKKLYRVVEAFSKMSGINVRVFIDRDAASENGQFIAGKNGGTIYINLAARPFADSAYGINQYVVSTLSHELTHWLKANNVEAYNVLEEAVKKDLEKNNTLDKRISTERDSLLRTHENELKEKGLSEEEISAEMEKYSKKKDLNEIALEEVVARACEDMLNDSDTMQEVLSFADQDGLTKLQAALNKWFEHIKAFFNDLMGGFHAPNEVVADLQKSYGHLKELWVKGMKEAIAQNRREQKTSQRAVASKKVLRSGKTILETNILTDGQNYTIDLNQPFTELKPFSDLMLKRWSNSKKIIPLTKAGQLGEFVLKAMSEDNFKANLYLGVVTDTFADKLMKEFNVNVKNYNLILTADDVRKEFNHHTNVKWETSRNQRIINENDFYFIPYVISNPDVIEDGGMYLNMRCFRAKRDGITVVVNITDTGLKVSMHSMYIDKNKGSLTAAPNEQAFGDTSETTDGMTSFENTIPQASKQSNNKSVKSEKLSSMGYTNQEHTSAGTSLKQNASTFTTFQFDDGERILDWGGGRYDISKRVVEKSYNNVTFEAVDQFNRTEEHNSRVLKEFAKNKATSLTINNVFNVIDSEATIKSILAESKKYLKDDGMCYIHIYTGNRSGIGRETSAGYQRNETADKYEKYVKKYYKNVRRAGDFILASDGEIKVKKLDEAHKNLIKKNTESVSKMDDLDMRESRYSTKIEYGTITDTSLKDLFINLNPDKEMKALGEKVFDAFHTMQRRAIESSWDYPYAIYFLDTENYRKKAGLPDTAGEFSPNGKLGTRGIIYNTDYMNGVSDNDKARIILHEVIHAVTVNAIRNAQEYLEPRKMEFISNPQKVTEDAPADNVRGGIALIGIYNQIRKDGADKYYGCSSVYEMVAELANPEFRGYLKKQSLWGKIIDAIKKILGLKDNAYDASVDALEMILSEYAPKTSIRNSVRLDSVETIGAADVDTKTGTAVYSVRYTLAERYKELGYNSYAEAVGKTAADIAKKMGVSKLKAEQWIKAEESLASFILKDAENQRYLDYVADDRYSAIKTDTDYPQGTIDLSNLCRKREIFTKMFDSLQRENPDILFTAEDIAKIRQILTEANYEVACALCYVEDRRQHIGEIAKSFADSYKKALASKSKVIYRTNTDGELKPLVVTEEQASKYGLNKGDYFKATDSYVPNQYDLTTYQGYKELVEKHPSVAIAFERFNNARGQSAARLIEGHAEYKREILKWSKAKVEKANNLGGLRVFSFSDFEAIHLIDIVQVVMDCSSKGVMIQAYTKVPSFANLVKNTNIKLNRSLIPANKGSKNAYAYINGKAVKVDTWVDDGVGLVDGKEVLAFDIVEGIDITDENFLDMSDNRNVGNILVGINKKQIDLAMEDDFIDYIIPFHTNQAKNILEAKDIHRWNNYKVSQLDKKVNGKGKDHGVNIYTDVINKYNIRNKKDFVRAFLNECKNQKYKPRFDEFLKRNSKGEYIYTEGYHKFLVDYKLFDTKGNILKQEAVKPDFDIELMNQILLADKARSMNMKFSDEIMDKVKKELSIDSRKSVKLNSEGNPLTKGQQTFFKNSKARDEQGRLLVMYHGSRGAGFTVFNPEYSDDGRSLFFSNRLDVASSYTSTKELFEPDKPMTYEELSEMIYSYFNGDWELIKDGKDYVITELGKIGKGPNELFRGTLKDAQTYFIDNIEDIVNEASAVYKVYLNLENPLVVDAKGNNWDELPLPEDYDESFSDIDIYESGDGFEADWTENGESKHGEFKSWGELEKKFGSLYEKLQHGTVHIDDIYLGFDGNRLPTNTREYATYAQNHGYDGVILNNVIDQGLYAEDRFGQSTVMIAFNANQIKSVYNENPTSNPDIRKSEKLDSNGKTLTPGQQTYFKDSKVRDDNGRLLVVYHGTNEEFDTFRPNDFIKERNGISRIVGYFSEDKSYSENYGNVKEYYLNITNPLVMDGTQKTLKEWKAFFKKNGITNVVFDSSVTGKNGQIDTLKGGTYDGITYYTFYEILDMYNYWYGDGNLTERIQEAGYDGIQSNDVYEKAWMPFNAEAVKSVDNTNPTDNPNTLKSTKLDPEAQKLIDELTLENKRLTEENTALKAEKGIEKVKAEKAALIGKITEQAQVLSRWLLTNDKNNPVPQAIKEPLGKLLTSISIEKDDYEWRKQKGHLTKSEETLGERMAKISQLLLEIEQDKVVDKDAYDLSQLDWIPEFTTEFAKIKDAVAAVEARQGENFNLAKMTTEDLQSLSNMITALKSAITNMNKCLSAHNKMSVSGVGREIVDYLDEVGQKTVDNRALQFLEIDNTVPFYFFKRLGPGGQAAFKLLMDGMNQYAFEAKQIEDYAKKTFSGKDVLSWRDQVKTFEVDQVEYGTKESEDLVSSHKATIKMTVPQIMSLYCLSKRDQAQNHLKTGGIKIGDFKVKGEKDPVRQLDNVTLTKGDLQKIISSLTEEQIEVADKLQEFMNTVCQKWGNEITMKRFGFKGMTEKNYFPITVDKNVLSREARQKGTSLYQLLNMGFTKPINPKAKNPIEIFDIFEVFAMHSTEMAQYNSLALPVLDVIRIWNYKDLEMLDEDENKAHWHSVKASIENTIGAKGNQYIGLLLADMNGDVSGGRADDVASTLMKNYKTASVAANLQVAALQPLAYIRAGYMIDPKYLAKGMAMKSTNEALKWCGIAVWKEMGFYNTSIHRGLEHKIMQDESTKDSLIEKGLWLAGKADEWTWSKLWNACLVETEDKYPDLKGDDLYKKTAERLTDVIYGTQVVDSILTRSQIMRDKTFYSKMITAFQSEPTLALNVLMDAAESFSMEARAHGKQAALSKYGATIRRATYVYLISCAVESALRAVIGKIRGYDGDDEDDESLIEDFLKRFIEELNPLRKIPLVKDAVALMVDTAKVILGKQYKIYTDTRMDEAIFENLGKAVIRISKLIEGKEVNYKALYEITKGIDASGLPASSTFRAFKVFWNNTIGRIWTSLAIK